MVLILCAGGLAVIVVYNLTNINISERKKELATLKVLGFHEQETAMYIYRETAALSLIGTLAGCFLGAALHRFVVACAEVDTV
ncbi:MAG: ABC transporter permease, partial [Bacteroidaceae bacterium]|nr:ABC transporter permease [Bacteroidaceae bacterium]